MTKEAYLEYHRNYYQKNKDKIKARRAKYRQDNKEKISALKAKSYQKNKEQIRVSGSEYYQKHKEQIAIYQTQYRRNNKDKMQSYKHKRRAHTANVGGSFTGVHIKDLYASQGARCYYCSISIEEGYHIEHMTPISRGGTNGPENICLACAPCNRMKFTKTAEEFLHVRE